MHGLTQWRLRVLFPLSIQYYANITNVISSSSMISFGSHNYDMWFHVNLLDLLYALHRALYHRHEFVKTSPRHRQNITITPLTHRGCSSVARQKITDYRRFLKYILSCWRRLKSANLPLCITKYSTILRQYIACVFLVGPHIQRRHQQAIYIARHFGSRGIIAFGAF